MSKNRVLSEASINPNAVRYNILAAGAVLVLTIVGIPLLLIYVPIAHWYWTKYYARLKVVLTTRELKVHRGILVREEKSIPLEKITDLAVVQGPIMRFMNLKGIRVETAGQSSGAGKALVQIVGIEDTDGFRDLVLEQRDRVTESESPGGAAVAFTSGTTSSATGGLPGNDAVLATLEDIRDTLRRIETGMASDEAR